MSDFEDKRVQTLFRLHKDDLDKLKARTAEDMITIQKLMEVLVQCYLNKDKHIMKIVNENSNKEIYKKKRRYHYTELEAHELLRKLEQLSPLKDIHEAFDEAEEEGII